MDPQRPDSPWRCLTGTRSVASPHATRSSDLCGGVPRGLGRARAADRLDGVSRLLRPCRAHPDHGQVASGRQPCILDSLSTGRPALHRSRPHLFSQPRRWPATSRAPEFPSPSLRIPSISPGERVGPGNVSPARWGDRRSADKRCAGAFPSGRHSADGGLRGSRPGREAPLNSRNDRPPLERRLRRPPAPAREPRTLAGPAAFFSSSFSSHRAWNPAERAGLRKCGAPMVAS